MMVIVLVVGRKTAPGPTTIHGNLQDEKAQRLREEAKLVSCVNVTRMCTDQEQERGAQCIMGSLLEVLIYGSIAKGLCRS